MLWVGSRYKKSFLNPKERMMDMEKYIMYLRKSQMDRDFEDVSVEETLNRHHKILSEFAAQRKLYVEITLKEVVSGEALSARPMMQKCLELVNTGEYAGVICMDIDRLSRGDGVDSGYITQVLKWNGCNIVTPQKTYDLMNDQDEQFTDMKFLFSRYELKTITKRMVNGRNVSASEGKFLGSIPPYGYEIYKLPGVKGNSLKIIPEQAEIVRMIFDMYINQNKGYNAIVYTLNQLRIPTQKGGKWTQTSVVNVITNPTYTGKIRWKYSVQQKSMKDGKLTKKRKVSHKYELHDGLHEAIISEDIYNKACEIRDNRYISSTEITKTMQSPFAEILRCGNCGSSVRRNTPSAKQVESRGTRPWYRCKKNCGCRMINCDVLEDAILEKMKDWLKEYTINIKEIEKKDDNFEVLLTSVQKQIADLQSQQNKICELLETGVYTVEMFTKRNATLVEEINELKERETTLQEKIAVQQSAEHKKNAFIPMTQQLLDSYDILTTEEKNQVWKVLLEKVTYYRKPGAGKKDFEVHIYPRIPSE